MEKRHSTEANRFLFPQRLPHTQREENGKSGLGNPAKMENSGTMAGGSGVKHTDT